MSHFLNFLDGTPNIQYSNFHRGSHGDQETPLWKEIKTRGSIDTIVFRNTMVKQQTRPIDQLSAVPFHGVHESIVRGRFTGGRRMCRRARAYPGASAFITRLSRLRLHVVAYTLDNTGYDAGLLVRRRSQRWSAIRGRLN